MAKLKVGDRVEVLGGMKEFVGQLGVVVDDSDRDGRTRMFRVELDESVFIPNVGLVDDDLWSGEFLRRLSRSEAAWDAALAEVSGS